MGSFVACGLAASSANVIAEMAISFGSASAFNWSMSTNTDASIMPRGCLATRRWVLIRNGVEVFSELFVFDARHASESGKHDALGYERAAPHWPQFPNRNAVASHNKTLPGV
jgi:hypothetical protein